MKVFIFCFLIFISVNVKAEDVAEFELSLQQGKWNLGLNGLLGYNEQRGGAIRIEGDLQYFVADRFSLGVVARTDLFRGLENNSFGVVGTYYFFQLSKSAFYISQSLTWDQDKRYSTRRREFLNTQTTLGYNMFLNEGIALGPRLQYDWNPEDKAYEKGTAFVGFGATMMF